MTRRSAEVRDRVLVARSPDRQETAELRAEARDYAVERRAPCLAAAKRAAAGAGK